VAEWRLVKLLSVDRYWAPNSNLSARVRVVCPISFCDRLSSEAKAEDVRKRSLKMQKEYLIKVSDAVIAIKTVAGPVKLNQPVNTAATGAASGSFWGLLVGVLFLTPIIGVALGAASGALGGASTTPS
jgi:uncharacterized membrane protein